MPRIATALWAVALVAACSPSQPPHWAEGGAQLSLARARWDRPGEATVDLLEDGRVLVDGDHLWTIDAVGRVVNSSNEPIALLEHEGSLNDSDRRRLGGVGLNSAAPPDSNYAWITLAPDGRVTRYSADGESHADGQWRGCEGHVVRSCTLVSHLISLRDAYRSSGGGSPNLGVGIGVGVGIGIGVRLRR